MYSSINKNNLTSPLHRKSRFCYTKISARNLSYNFFLLFLNSLSYFLVFYTCLFYAKTSLYFIKIIPSIVTGDDFGASRQAWLQLQPRLHLRPVRRLWALLKHTYRYSLDGMHPRPLNLVVEKHSIKNNFTS